MDTTSAAYERLSRRLERERRARLEAEAIAEQATRAALHDPLTGLPNRALVMDRLETALARRERRPGEVALLFVDLDRFKLINDSLGHEVGDALLVEFSGRLRGASRTADTVGRLGGDEFVVLCEEVGGPDAALAIAHRLVEAISPPVLLDGVELRISASIGVALSDGHASADELIRDCDAAMYHAKDGGRGRCELFEESVRTNDRNHLRMESDLRLAVEQGAFELHYQPIVDVSSRQMTGIEPLVRWRHPTRGLVPPLEFIPLAEQCGLIAEIDGWVLRHACEQALAWGLRYGEGAPSQLSVNLSAVQLADPGLNERVAAILHACGFPARHLTLEITESVLVAESTVASANLESLHRQGIRLAIDDFGTGYCSLAYLRQFAVDALKIHQSFVAGFGSGGNDAAIVEAIVAMGRALELEIIAEGIELSEQLARADELGCSQAQGFLFGRPLPAHEFEREHLARRSRAA